MTTDRVIAIIWGVQMPLKYFSATEWKRANIKIEYFLHDYFGGVKTQK